MAALVAIRDGLLKQSMTMVEHRVQQLLSKLQDEHIAPLNTYVSEAQAKSFRSDFFEQNKDLEKYESLVDAVAAKLQQAGYKGVDRAEVMKKFADETRAVIKTMIPETNGAGVVAKTNGATPTRKMASLTGGGHPSGGKGTVAESKGPAGIEVFD